MDDHTNDVPNEILKPRKGKRVWKAKSYGFDFQLLLVEGSRDQVGSQYLYCYSIEEDPRTYNEAMQSHDAAFWKEIINDEIGYKWIFKRKMKVDGAINKFKARLVIQGFRQKEGNDYFDTYAPVARITTIRLLLALETIHNLLIYQMDVKTTFLNGDLDKEVYMKQPEGFVMSGNKHKVCKLVKSLYGLKQAPKQWHQKFDEVVLSSGFHLNQSNKLFSASTPMDLVENLKPNTRKPVDQLKYSRAIGFLMYAMTSTRLDIAYAVGRLSRFTSNPSRHHWKTIIRVFKYLRGTKDYGLSYVGNPSLTPRYFNIAAEAKLGCLTSWSMISTGSSTKLSLSSSRSSFIGMTRDSLDRHFFKLETWKGLSFPRFPNWMTPFLACKFVGFVLSFRWFNGLSLVPSVRHLQLQSSRQENSTSVGRLTLGLLPSYTSCFSRFNVNSLTVNHMPEKLHDTDPEITFGELGI
uniref:Zinc finger, CCHC-type n=1 Tax=Tanacetum cinerariifolium TaxID=118510 RepID=A0A699HD45_TANCI|nr:zinc finger, CCHC-type [Tanacetum cinerariifolium]